MSAEPGPITFAMSPWVVHVAEPTTVLIFAPGEVAPSKVGVLSRLPEVGARAPAHRNELADQPGVAWQCRIELPEVGGAAIIWCERAQQVAPGTFGDAAIENALWVIGMQTLLNRDDPAESYANLMRAAIRAVPATPGVLDLVTHMCHPRVFIDSQLAIADAPAPADWLWRINAMSRGASTADNATTWLRTVGLSRCGLPELEMFNVPAARADAAAKLIDLLAEQMFESELPEPAVNFEVGAGLRIALRSFNEIDQARAAHAPDVGAMRDATGVGADKPAAVIVNALSDPDAPPSIRPPVDVLQAIGSGAAAVYRTTRATARQAALARVDWPRLLEHWRQTVGRDEHSGAHTFLVQAALTPAGGEGCPPREHLWFEVESIDNGAVIARPVHESATDASLTTDDQCTIDPAGISDWMIITPHGRINPSPAANARPEHQP